MQPLELNQGAVRDDFGGRAESQTVILLLSHFYWEFWRWGGATHRQQDTLRCQTSQDRITAGFACILAEMTSSFVDVHEPMTEVRHGENRELKVASHFGLCAGGQLLCINRAKSG